MSEAAKPEMSPEEKLNNTPIKLELPLIACNQILFALSKLPYDQVAGTILAIRQQGDPQSEIARQAIALASAPPSDAPANGNRKTRRATKRKKA